MELRLNRERVDCCACMMDRTTEDTFSVDIVIPDSLPDAANVVLTDGDFCLWRLDLSSGSAEAEGEWKGSACYTAEETDSLHSFPVSAGVRLRVTDDRIVPEHRPYAEIRVCEVTSQLMNSRKMRLRVRVSLHLQLYASVDTEITALPETVPEDLHILTEPKQITVVSAVEEQVFAAGDRIPLLGETEARLLSVHSRIVTDQALSRDSGAILNGTVIAELLFENEQTGALYTQTAETTFSQLLDISADAKDDLLPHVQLTSAEVNPTGDGAVITEYHFVVQTLCVRHLRLSVPVDAYSIRDQLELSTEQLSCHDRGIAQAITAYADAETSISPDSNVIMCSATLLRPFQFQEGMQKSVMSVNVIYTDHENTVASLHETVPITVEAEEHETVESVQIQNADVQIKNGKLHVLIPVELCKIAENDSTVMQICEISRIGEDPEKQKLPAVTLLRWENMNDLWDAAKRYCSSEDAIRAANPDLETSDAAFILIPRQYA